MGFCTLESPGRNHSLIQTTYVLESGGVSELHSGTHNITGPELSFRMNRDSILDLMMDNGGYGGRMGQQWSPKPLQYLEAHPHTIKETKHLLVNPAMFSGSIFVPLSNHTLIRPSLKPRLNLDSSEKTILDQLSSVFHCVTLVHHRILARLLFGLMRGFLLVTVQRPDYEYVSRELVVKPLCLACHSTCG